MKKPPVDIEVDPDDGHLCGIQVVLQDESPKASNRATSQRLVCPGLPIFSTSLWEVGERCVTEIREVFIEWSAPECLLVLFEDALVIPCTEYIVDRTLSCFSNDLQSLIGIRVSGFTRQQLNTLAMAR